MLINSEIIKSGFSRSILFLLGVIIAGFIIRINYVYDDNVMVTQKVRKAQERNSRSRGNSRNKVS